MTLCYVILGILAAWVLFYACLELHYFFRICIVCILARFCKKRVHILGETRLNGICLTTDIDTYKWHMNNARFIRELDFARVDLYERTGLYATATQKGGVVVMGACTIRYRRFLKLFSRFVIASKIMYWDSQSVFIEHKFITPKDNFINAIAISRIRIVNCDVEDIMKELLEKCKLQDTETPTKVEKPEIPLEIARWIECNEISSNKLRNGA